MTATATTTQFPTRVRWALPYIKRLLRFGVLGSSGSRLGTAVGPFDDLNAQIVRSIADGLWIIDDRGATVFASDRLARMLGYTPEQMLGLPLTAVLDDAGRTQFGAHLHDLAAADSADCPGEENLECYFLRADGTQLWALVSHSPLLDADGVRRGWLHRVTERTDRKLVLDKVTASERRLAEAQSIAKVGSWEWDVRRDVVTWSDEMFRQFDLDPQEFEATYEGFLGCLHPEDSPMVDEAVGAAIGGTDAFAIDCRVVKSSGGLGWVRGRGRVTRDETGAAIRMSGTSQEITDGVLASRELAAARDEAVDASRLKSEFLTTMSHEIRTPLNGVIGLTDLLRRTELDPSQQQLATGISQAGRNLLGLLNDILDFSKIEAGKLEIEAVDFDLQDVLDQVSTLQAEPARAQHVTLAIETHPDVPATVHGDPGRFRQVITNLVSNAVKFTQDGTVTLTVTPAETGADAGEGPRMLRIEVRDTGIGIPAEAQPTLFDSFTQADASTTRAYGGTGLGLTISRRLVEAMGGDIGFTSEPGAGSTFWFTARFDHARAISAFGPTLVTDRDGATPADPGIPAPGRVPVTGLGTVLVAEDNLLNQMVAGGFLEALGYDAEFAADGTEAVAAVTSRPGAFMAVLMDCHMPSMDGYDATRAIREHEQGTGARIPVIAMTASAALGERAKCMAAGMDDFILKPADFAALEHALACWTGSGTSAAGTTKPSVNEPGDRVLDDDRIAMLADLRPGQHSFLTQFIETFLDRTPTAVDAIIRAFKKRDHAALVRAAHLLKGSALNLGVSRVGRVCQELEAAAGRGDLTHAAALIAELSHEAAQARLALVDVIAARAQLTPS